MNDSRELPADQSAASDRSAASDQSRDLLSFADVTHRQNGPLRRSLADRLGKAVCEEQPLVPQREYGDDHCHSFDSACSSRQTASHCSLTPSSPHHRLSSFSFVFLSGLEATEGQTGIIYWICSQCSQRYKILMELFVTHLVHFPVFSPHGVGKLLWAPDSQLY